MKHAILLLVAILFFWSCKKEKISVQKQDPAFSYTISIPDTIILSPENNYESIYNRIEVVRINTDTIPALSYYMAGIPINLYVKLDAQLSPNYYNSTSFSVSTLAYDPQIGVFNAKLIALNKYNMRKEFPFTIIVKDTAQ